MKFEPGGDLDGGRLGMGRHCALGGMGGGGVGYCGTVGEVLSGTSL